MTYRSFASLLVVMFQSLNGRRQCVKSFTDVLQEKLMNFLTIDNHNLSCEMSMNCGSISLCIDSFTLNR